MLRIAFALSFCLRADAQPQEVLPAPPKNATALALAEYQRAEQEFAQGDYAAAEAALKRSWDAQKHPLTQYNLALVHLKQGRLQAAVRDMMIYFSDAPPAMKDPNNAAARQRLHRIRVALGARPAIDSLTADAVAAVRRGDYSVLPDLDRGLEETADMSLLYWIVLGEFRSVQARTGPAKRFQHISPIFLANMRALLQGYFNGATDLSQTFDAQRLSEELDGQYRRALAFDLSRRPR